MSAPQITKSSAQPSGRTEQRLKEFHEEGAIARSHDLGFLKRLWPFIKPHKKYLVTAIMTILIAASLQLVRPLLMGSVVAHAEQKQADLLLRDGLLLTALTMFGQILVFVQVYTIQLCGSLTMADLRRHVFLFFQKLGLRFFDKTPVGRLVTRATGDVDAVGELFASGVINAIGDLITLLGIIIMMLVLNYRLALIAFIAFPIVGILAIFVRNQAKKAYREIRVKTARLNAFLNEQVGGVSVVQAYNKEESMEKEFDAINGGYRDANKRSIFYESFLDAVIELVSTLCISSLLWWALFRRFSSDGVSFALIVTFTQYLRQFFEPISLLAQRYTVLQSAMSGAERIFQLLDEPTEESAQNPLGEAETEKMVEEGESESREALAFRHVGFSYRDGVPVLQDVTFQVAPGERVALVGPTGAGKTTVTSLVLRLYEITEGEVRIFGKSLSAYSKEELRKLFSVVPQDVVLFSGTVLSNIALGDPVPHRERAEKALDRIGALAWIQKRPSGLDAIVDERGSNFSAGERQLIAFARAMYRDAPFLILDEATANIDSDTESRLQRALDAAMQGRTVLVVAHRLSTVRSADRILVFQRGKIVETGTHQQLIKLGGLYQKLYELQFSKQH